MCNVPPSESHTVHAQHSPVFAAAPHRAGPEGRPCENWGCIALTVYSGHGHWHGEIDRSTGLASHGRR